TWDAPGFATEGLPVTMVARMTGVVKRVAVSKGQRIKAGDVLVVFDTHNVDSAAERTTSARPRSADEIRKAGEAVEMARLKLGAAKTDADKKTAQTALERALARQAEMRARSSGAQSAHLAEEAMRDAATILAPSAGKITDLFVVSGKLVAAQTPL